MDFSYHEQNVKKNRSVWCFLIFDYYIFLITFEKSQQDFKIWHENLIFEKCLFFTVKCLVGPILEGLCALVLSIRWLSSKVFRPPSVSLGPLLYLWKTLLNKQPLRELQVGLHSGPYLLVIYCGPYLGHPKARPLYECLTKALY